MELMRRARHGKRPRGGRAEDVWSKRTRSSFIAGLRRGDRKVALPALCDAYWGPLFDFICAKGCTPDDAHDVTQAFFTAMLKPGFFATFDPARGKFRNWLRTAAKYFYFNWKRQGRLELVGVGPATIEQHLERARDADSETDRAFDRSFADAVVGRALERLRQWYAEEGEPALFSQVHLAVLGERRTAHDAATAKVLGKSISALKQRRHEQKRVWTLRYQGCLREEIAALGVRRASIASVIAELLDAAR